ncbi:MAG TPA: cysteine desulfurase family protein [Spirochaetota bacterium]|nr:cysteine desulfurase family protein [Spirochaetota bacterium]HOM38811.1 cysteine desulfurase family protein [Spirochaetota bacterium]HPQ49869.1 cysteine desulfurase family protein [Spirochaetota bacterium]
MVYLDNNATTPLLPEVAEEMKKCFNMYGNPSSLHSFGREIKEKIEYARFQVARFINCNKNNIVFTSGGSEGNNCIINSFFSKYKNNGKLLVSKIEHPSILNYAKYLLSIGYDIDFIDVDSKGKVLLDRLEDKLKTEKRVMISVMIANNETGIIQDIENISSIARKYGAFIHSDMVQGLGKMVIDLEKIDVDYATFSSHKINGPKGIGAIYIKDIKDFMPFIHGGHQEKGLRAGTENTLGIIGFGKACEIREKELFSYIQKMSKLREKLLDGIINNINDILINTDMENSVPNTLNISFKGVEGEAIMLYLDIEGIAVSTGSACSSGELEPSHVLLAMGLDPEIAHGSIRFSLGIQNTEEDLFYVVDRLKNVISKLRKISSVYSKGAGV